MTLCDTGPMIALVDADDPHHARCVDSLVILPPTPLITTWPCLTEAMHLLHRSGGVEAQNELWGFFADGLLRLYLPAPDEWRRIHSLMNDYADLPLDMADASLASAAEVLGNKRLFSLDSGLRAVRLENGQAFDFVP